MINSYLKTALRSISRKKTFAILNIAGLATGIAAALVIFLVIRYEHSYDTYHRNAGNIYRITTDVIKKSNGEVTDRRTNVPIQFEDRIKEELPLLEKTAAISQIMGGAQIYIPGTGGAEKRFKQPDIFFTSPDLYRIFDYTWLAGNADGLSAPNTVVISESTAKAYFGAIDKAIGNTIQMWSYRIPLQVTGVFKDLPTNTDMPVKLGISMATLRKLSPEAFSDLNLWDPAYGWQKCFVLLKNKAQIAAVTAALPAFVSRHYKDQTTQRVQLHLQPVQEMHLDKDYPNFEPMPLTSKELWALGLIGIFLLLVACINFINLATALSVNRAKEIGVRKVLGSNRLQLLSQFLMETALITVVAVVIAVTLVAVTLPHISALINIPLPLTSLAKPDVWITLILCTVAVTFLSGFYPGTVVSGFNPILAIKSRISTQSTGGTSLRRGLVVFQFMIAQLLIIGTLVVVKQMRYVKQQSMGFTRDAVVLIDLPSDSALKVKYDYMVQRLAAIPGVQATSLCGDAPSSDRDFQQDFHFDNNPVKAPFRISARGADTGFYATFNIRMITGRTPYASDTLREIVVNETTVKKLGLSSPEAIIGKTLTFGSKKFPVVGVFHDFNNKSLHEAILPLFMGPSKDSYSFVALRLQPEKMIATLKTVEQTFTGIYPSYLYDLTFLDQRISDYYQSEMITSRLFQLFAGMAIFISCLGLYGLISFMVVHRTREVGIRKVLGASVGSILLLFSREFMLLIGIAFLLAAPLGYYFMQLWLSDFYYHTVIGSGIFIAAIGLSVLMSWATVGYKTWIAARANPVKQLKE
ncbi:MAG: ABC transporter permease [Chitinophaga sp.]|uniref:ABC transporter permease n=1 Tax=Chitinophaga sp. TaxID=1869181 RepID=UPI001B2E9743|nr:ABC transporter permease [Chitinophaga sp.]MBO9730847.1 ABC transporter permease [Chitinophaga sp.]